MASRFKQRGILNFLATPLVSSLAGSALSGAIGRANQEDAQDFNREMYGSRYQMQMEDMRKAGLNPMLSYLQSPSSSPGSPIASVPDFGSTINQSRMADASGVSSVASAQTAASYENMANETVRKTKQEVENLKSVNAQVLQATDNLRQEYQNLVKQGLNLTEVGNQIRKTIDKMDADIKLIGNQTLTEHYRKFLTENQAKTEFEMQLLRKAEAEIAGVESRGAQSFGEVGNTVKHLRPFLELLWNATKR